MGTSCTDTQRIPFLVEGRSAFLPPPDPSVSAERSRLITVRQVLLSFFFSFFFSKPTLTFQSTSPTLHTHSPFPCHANATRYRARFVGARSCWLTNSGVQMCRFSYSLEISKLFTTTSLMKFCRFRSFSNQILLFWWWKGDESWEFWINLSFWYRSFRVTYY